MLFIIFIYLPHYFTTHKTNNKYQKGTYKLGNKKRETEENYMVRGAQSSSRNVIDQHVVSAPTELFQQMCPRNAFDRFPLRSPMTLS